LRRGEVYIERLSTREAGRPIDVPDGLIHHWLGTVFVPGASLGQALDLLQDYDRHAEIYSPAIARRAAFTACASRRSLIRVRHKSTSIRSDRMAGISGGFIRTGGFWNETPVHTYSAKRFH
jgi:hypothetical protein